MGWGQEPPKVREARLRDALQKAEAGNLLIQRCPRGHRLTPEEVRVTEDPPTPVGVDETGVTLLARNIRIDARFGPSCCTPIDITIVKVKADGTPAD